MEPLYIALGIVFIGLPAAIFYYAFITDVVLPWFWTLDVVYAAQDRWHRSRIYGWIHYRRVERKLLAMWDEVPVVTDGVPTKYIIDGLRRLERTLDPEDFWYRPVHPMYATKYKVLIAQARARCAAYTDPR